MQRFWSSMFKEIVFKRFSPEPESRLDLDFCSDLDSEQGWCGGATLMPIRNLEALLSGSDQLSSESDVTS